MVCILGHSQFLPYLPFTVRPPCCRHGKFMDIYTQLLPSDLTLEPIPWATFYSISYCVLPSLLLLMMLPDRACPSFHLPPIHSSRPSSNITSSVKPSLHSLIRINQNLYCAPTAKPCTCWPLLVAHCGLELVDQCQNWITSSLRQGYHMHFCISGG